MKQSLKWLTWLLIVGSLPGLAAEPSAGGSEPSPWVSSIGVEEVHRGQKGYGLSVFVGTEPVRFEVEVLGVMANATPELSYVIARLSGQDLERSGVLAGMSGSPVFIDGRLLGAVSFSYLFGLDPIAGITPIAAMRRLSKVSAGASSGTTSSPAGPLSGGVPARTSTSMLPASAITLPLAGEAEVPASALTALVHRDFEPEALARALSRLRPTGTNVANPALQWTATGFSSATLEILRAGLGSLAPASGGLSLGGAASGQELVPGGAVAALLVTGDLSLAAHGTVTDRRGDEILAFGHPLFSLGPTKVPMAISEVITVIPSRYNSFKLSTAGAVIGAFDQDREAGARGVIGLAAPMIPLTVRLRGLVERDYAMQVVDLTQLSPAMVAISTLGALTAGSFSSGDQGIDMDALIRLRGYQDLRIRQSFDGNQAGTEAAIYLLSFMSYLMQNSLQAVQIEGVDVQLDQVGWIRQSMLVRAEAERLEVRPGETLGLSLTFQPYRGEPYRQRSEVTIPDDTPEGSYYLMLGDGTSMDGVRVAVEKRQPQTLAQSLDLLASFGSRRQLRIFGLVAGPGLATAGEVLPLLPGSLRSIFGAGSTAPGLPLRLAIHQQQEEWLERPFEGVQRIDLKVKKN